MRKLVLFVAVITASVGFSVHSAAGQYTPKRINKGIELLEQGQPVYFLQIPGGGYEVGRQMAQTWADIIGYNVEQAPFSPVELRAFMQGLIDGGPTKSGHRTPAVVVVLPFGGIDEMVVRANYWVVEQALAAGAHGVALTHARSPGAVRAFVRAARYPHAPPAPGIEEGLRGSGGQGLAATVWGISASEYLAKADAWPLNPAGELLLALKVEDRWALPGVDEILGVPGISFLEAGPSDLHMSLGYPPPVGNQYAAEVVEARRRIAAAAKKHGVLFAEVGITPANVSERIDAGSLFFFGNEALAQAGRKHSRRVMPY